MELLRAYLSLSLIIASAVTYSLIFKRDQQYARGSYFYFSCTIFLFLFFSIIHAYWQMPTSALLVAFLGFIPLFILTYLFFSIATFEMEQRYLRFLKWCALHTTGVVALIVFLALQKSTLPLSHPLIADYVILSTIIMSIMGLLRTWHQFRRTAEFQQACISCYLLASLLIMIVFYVNVAIYHYFPVLWSTVFLIPYLYMITCVVKRRNIAFIEKILQAILVKIMMFGIYYAMVQSYDVLGFRLEGKLGLRIPALICFIAIMVMSYRPLEHLVIKMLKSILFRPVINYRLMFRNFFNALLAFVETQKIVEVIVNFIYESYDAQMVSCFLYDSEKKKYVRHALAGTAANGIVEIDENHPFVTEVRKKFRVITVGDLNKNVQMETIVLFKQLHAAVAVPFNYREHGMGFLFLGEKKDGTKYTIEDIDLFTMLEGQISVALNNALFFKTQQTSYELMAQKNKMDAVIALSGGVNHEINNPLSIISMKAQNFLRKIKLNKFNSEEETIREAIEVIESALRNSGRAHMITRRLGDFAKPAHEGGEPENIDLLLYVRETIALIGTSQFAHANINVLFDFPETLAPVRCDKSHLQQILFNVIMNAYHAIVRDGTITVRAREHENGFVCVEVIDNGCGIKASEIEKIWEPFFTTKPQKPAAENKFTGTGLGLALVKRYIEESHGYVEVKSEVGVGSTFYLYLPRGRKPADVKSEE